jgi:hypothetical protein
MKNLENYNAQEMSLTEVMETVGGTLTKNEARLVAFCIGGLVGLALFELSSSLPK